MKWIRFGLEMLRWLSVVLAVLLALAIRDATGQTIPDPVQPTQGPRFNADSWGRMVIDLYAEFPNGGDEDLTEYRAEILMPVSLRCSIGIGYGMEQRRLGLGDNGERLRSFTTSVRVRFFIGD